MEASISADTAAEKSVDGIKVDEYCRSGIHAHVQYKDMYV